MYRTVLYSFRKYLTYATKSILILQMTSRQATAYHQQAIPC
nr:MAG TPA: hypothetical protein [Caudoviricetes sp.]